MLALHAHTSRANDEDEVWWKQWGTLSLTGRVEAENNGNISQKFQFGDNTSKQLTGLPPSLPQTGNILSKLIW